MRIAAGRACDLRGSAHRMSRKHFLAVRAHIAYLPSRNGRSARGGPYYF